MLFMSTKAIQIGTINRNSPQLSLVENFVSVLSGALQDGGGGGGGVCSFFFGLKKKTFFKKKKK